MSRLICVIGPSGVGKDTLIEAAVAARPGLKRARRAITRPAGAGGEAFEALSVTEFECRLAAGGFALHWRANGLAYGVAHAQLAPLALGEVVILNGSRGAAAAIRAACPGVEFVQIEASPERLAERLRARGRESVEAIAARLRRAAEEPPVPGAWVIRNDGPPDQALGELLGVIDAARGAGLSEPLSGAR